MSILGAVPRNTGILLMPMLLTHKMVSLEKGAVPKKKLRYKGAPLY